ncbi:MAG: hypothetical protein AB8G16_00965 [Gammaproteobacteria bacterium]
MIAQHCSKRRYTLPDLLAPLWLIITFMTAACVQAADVPLPTRDQIPGGPPLRVDDARAVQKSGDEPETVTKQGVPHALGAGTLVNIAEVPRMAPRPRPKSVATHKQGDGAATAGGKPARAKPTLPSVPATIEDFSSDQRATGDLLWQFDGIDRSQSSYFPPDTNLAVGPQYLVEVVNSGFAVYAKNGDLARSYLTFDSLLAGSFPDGWEGYTFDPRIVFDPTHEKYVMLILGKDEGNETSGYWLAVSQTDDPRDNWCVRGRDVSNPSDPMPTWLDFAGLGSDPYGVYVTGNYIYFDGSGTRGAAIHSFPSELMTGCGPVNGAVIEDIEWPNSQIRASSLQPALAHTSNVNEETFFVNTHPDFGDQVMLSRLSGNRSNNPSLTSVSILIPAYGAVNETVEQPNSANRIDGGRSKVLSAVYVDGRILFSLATLVGATPRASGWLTVELATGTNSVVEDKLYWLGEGRYVTYPALVYGGDQRGGNLALFGSETDNETFLTPATRYPSGFVRMYSDWQNGTAGSGYILHEGDGPYAVFDDIGRNRWGDYSGGAYDWTCGHAWGAVESATGPTSWKTTIAAIELDGEGGCPMIYVTSPVQNQPLNSGGTFHIQWDAYNLPPTDDIYLFYDTDDDLPVQIGAAIAVDQSGYFWQVPELPANDVRIIVGSYTGSEYSALHYSDKFTIVDTQPPAPNPLEWQNAPTATATDTIAMSTLATDGSERNVSYLFEFAGNPNGGSGGISRDWGFLPAYQNAGLQPNYEYCYRAIARDPSLNTTGYTATECVFTLAEAPSVGGFQDVAATSITVVANTGANSGATTYQFENLQLGRLSDWLDEPLWQDTGLLPDQTFIYRVRARNGNDIASAWTTLGAITTTNDDADGDGVLAADDNCLNTPNADQRDTDGDRFGNACDFDVSQDCVVNVIDLGIVRQRFFSTDDDADFNGDGIVNVVDLGLLRTGFFAPPGPSGRPTFCSQSQ